MAVLLSILFEYQYCYQQYFWQLVILDTNTFFEPCLEMKVLELCDELQVTSILVWKVLIREYVNAMHPVARSLAILQGEKAASLGYLLLTLAVTVNLLNALLKRPYKSINFSDILD